MEVRSHFKLFIGVLFAVFGMIGIFNLWDFFSVNLPWQVWPIGIILVGVLFMVRQKGFAFGVIGMMIVLGIFSSGWDCCREETSREFVREFDLVGVEYVDLDLDYGLGDIKLIRGERDVVMFKAVTRDFDDPKIRDGLEGDKMNIEISRDGGAGKNDEWFFELGEMPVYNLDLDYGVADVELDFRGLKVDRLEISEGVSDTLIVFEEYPTVANIEGGVSDLIFEFARGYGVVIDVDGGLLDEDFDGFARRDGKWYSEGFDEDGDNIEILFEGGISDISAMFY